MSTKPYQKKFKKIKSKKKTVLNLHAKKTKKTQKNIPKIPDENGFTQILELRWTKLGATPF